MELKTKYQYTHFIYPYVIKENKYIKHLLGFLKNKKFSLKIFQREKDIDIYNYFLPKVRDYMFSTFSFNKAKVKALEEMNVDMQATLLAKYPCVMFEYNIKEDVHGKTGEEEGIFFKVQELKVICFNTGICFLCIKTNIEDSNDFSALLNFNYKFRDINQEFNNLNNYDKIRLQSGTFKDIQSLTQIIKEITGKPIDAEKLDINTERFLTYSYACIDQENWGVNSEFEPIRNDFIKYINILPNDNSVNFAKENAKIISEWKYAKIGITKPGVALLCSSQDINNYTVFMHEYETKYLYTYIFTLYKKLYLKKIGLDFKVGSNIDKARKEFSDFTKKLWIQEITQDQTGTDFYNNLKEVLELDQLYYKTKNKYDVLYKELNIEKDRKVNKFIAVVLVASLIFNVLNFITLAMK